jgi:chemotaxis protein methyltransferase CheR
LPAQVAEASPRRLGERDFARLVKAVREACGIHLGPGKRTMLEGRLRRRLRALGLASFSEYVELLADSATRERELPELIDAVTTNETSFYREAKQFAYLATKGLERLAAAGAGSQWRLGAWSAGCSTGEEPYTLAMVLAEAAPQHLPRGFNVLATDISQAALAQAERAIYPAAEVARLPPAMLSRYVMRARDQRLGVIRIAPELRRLVRFEHLNLVAPRGQPRDSFDLVFCRNVLIYFAPAERLGILKHLCARLRPGGILCLGHADGSAAAGLPLRALLPNTFERV